MIRSHTPSFVAALLWIVLGGCGSASNTGPEPELSLATSTEAQAQFRALRQQWVGSPLDARVGLQGALTTFVQRYPTDPQGRWARLYLAWIALQRGELELAERWLALAEPGSAGSASDLGGVLGASLDLARGQPEAAYRQLLDLQGGLIDADDRLLCLDQLVLAAQASGHYRQAVAHMLELAAQAARRHRERIWRTLEPRLAKMPLPVLEASLSNLSSAAIQSASVRPAERAAAVDWMRRQILELLSRSAISAQDVELAQRLVATPSNAEANQAEKSELLLLATRGGMAPTIVARTVGLALQLGDPVLTQRSLDVATGIASTLELITANGGAEQIVLQTRHEERGAMGDVLARLAGDGASVLLAGLDPHGARLAADFSGAHDIPVLLLHEPTGDRTNLPTSAYVLGADDVAANQVLYRALERRTSSVILVGSPAFPCPKGDSEATLPRSIPAGSIPAGGIPAGGIPAGGIPAGGILSDGGRVAFSFEGSANCARNVLMGVAGSNRPWAVGLGLNALGLLGADLDVHEVWAVGAGRLPTFDGPRAMELERWLARKGRAPTWYEALGHDAARFVEASLGPAPPSPIRDRAAVAATHRGVSLAIARAALPDLWTSDADKFASDRHLPREFRAVRVDTQRSLTQ